MPLTARVTIRDLDTRVEEALRLRAACNGCSVEAEARALLVATVAPAPPPDTVDLAEVIRSRFAPLGGVELEPHPPVATGRPPRFED